MSILYLLIPLAAILAIIGVIFFIWSVKSGQFEDLEGPGFRILMDDDEDLIPDDAKVHKKSQRGIIDLIILRCSLRDYFRVYCRSTLLARVCGK